MSNVPSAFASLLPAAGAIALIVQGMGRRSRARSGEPALPIMQPKEPVAPGPRARRAPLEDTACAACGTSIPGGTTHCAPCARAAARPDATLSSTALNWLFLVGILGVVIGAGWLLSP